MSLVLNKIRRNRTTVSTDEVISDQLASVSTTDSNYNIKRKEAIDTLIDKLLQFFDIQDDWDGNDAKAPPVQLVRNALGFVSQLRFLNQKADIPIDVSIGPDGAILFEYQEDNLELEFQTDYKVYLRFFGDEGVVSTQLGSDLE